MGGEEGHRPKENRWARRTEMGKFGAEDEKGRPIQSGGKIEVLDSRAT